MLSPAAFAMAETREFFRDELTLVPQAPSVDQGDVDVEEELAVLADDGAAIVPPEQFPRAKSPTDVSGLDFADFNNHVKAIAYRTGRGVGMGLATTGGVALTGGFAVKEGMRVNLYYVRRWSPLDNTAREIGIDFAGQPDKTIGITVGWKF